MNFKEKSIKVKKRSNFTSHFFGLFGVIIIFFIGLYLIQGINHFNFDFQPYAIHTDTKINSGLNTNILQKETINILLTGRGGGDHDAPNLTDTIILLSYDTKKGIVSMFSIPRDLYVDYPNGKSGKINEIYRIEGVYKGSKKKGILALKKKIEEISGQKIDFYINVDFKGFVQIIDAFGGVEITLDKQFQDLQYPDGKGGYTTFVLREGTWTLSGEVALKYVRSRHSTSDFDRGHRQQQVLKSLKNKIIEGGFIGNSLKIKSLYNIFKNYVETDIDLENMIKLGIITQKSGDVKMISFNLNDSCFYGTLLCEKGGFLYIPDRTLYDNLSVLLVENSYKGNLNDYSAIENYNDLIYNYQEMYLENHVVHIYNGARVGNLASRYADTFKKYGFNVPGQGSIGNTQQIFEKSIIYYNNKVRDSMTLQALQKFYSGSLEIVENPVFSSQNETMFEVVLGLDYEDVFRY